MKKKYFWPSLVMDERHKELRPTSCNGPSIDYADVQMKRFLLTNLE
jgi:hypothetical protein